MSRYNLVFQGQILEEASLDEVKDKLARLFKADEKKMARLFSGKPIVIKKELELATAKQYLSVFKQAGAQIKAVKAPPGKTANEAEGTQAAKNSSIAENDDTGLTLAAANTGVFPKLSSNVAVEVADISQLSMSPPQSGSLQDCAEIIIPAVIPDTDHISLAAPDSGSLEAFIQPVEGIDIPDISTLKLATQDGQDLSAESQKPVPVEIPHSSELSLAEAGKGSLEGLCSKAEPVDIPDFSHLQFETTDNSHPDQGKANFKID